MARAQNSGGTKKVGRPFKKGQSGNPGGRPKGFGARIRELTSDGEELLEIALGIARGQVTIKQVSLVSGEAFDVGPDFKERMEAVKWLGDHGFGKPVQAVANFPGAGSELAKEVEEVLGHTPGEVASELRRRADALEKK